MGGWYLIFASTNLIAASTLQGARTESPKCALTCGCFSLNFYLLSGRTLARRVQKTRGSGARRGHPSSWRKLRLCLVALGLSREFAQVQSTLCNGKS